MAASSYTERPLPREVTVIQADGSSVAFTLSVASTAHTEQIAEWEADLRAFPPNARQEDAFAWEWGSLASDGQHCFPIEAEQVVLAQTGLVHAFMITTLPKLRPAGLPASVRNDVLWIEYIAVAPWHRKECPPDVRRSRTRHTGLGSELFRYAIERSRTRGRDGRIGLHSLKQSEPLYRDGFKMKPGRVVRIDNQPYRVFAGSERWADDRAPRPRAPDGR